MRRVFRSWTVATVGVLMAAVAASGADWQPPNDGVVTDKQFSNYVQVLKDLGSGPGRARTANPLLVREVLWPIELRDQARRNRRLRGLQDGVFQC